MKIKYVTLMFLSLSIATLTGCGVIELTDNESDLIAEYCAGILVADSPNYQGKLITGSAIEIPEATPTPQGNVAPTIAPTVEPSPVTTSTVSTQTTGTNTTAVASESPSVNTTPAPEATAEPDDSNTTLTELYHLNNIEFDYSSYRFTKEYSEKNSAFSISADDEQLLLISSFSVKNTSGKKKKVDLMAREIQYVLNADGFEYKPTISMLNNGGLNYLKTSIQAGKSTKALLIFAVPRKIKQAEVLSLTISEGNKKVNIKIK